MKLKLVFFISSVFLFSSGISQEVNFQTDEDSWQADFKFLKKKVEILAPSYQNLKNKKAFDEMYGLINSSQNSDFNLLREDFYNGYNALELPGLQVNYVDVLNNIQTKSQIEKQSIFFSSMNDRWSDLNPNMLNEQELLDYRIIGYEISLNLERISLERKWDNSINISNKKSIYSVPFGKDWYTYLLKRWVDISVKPNELFEFGLKEIHNVKLNMDRLQQKSGFSGVDFEKYLESDHFLIHEPNEVKEGFTKMKNIVKDNASNMFPYLTQIPNVNIEKGTNEDLAHVPAYYNNNTFYYNLFDEPFNKRQIGWFYVHEAIPGHHYQSSINTLVNRSDIQNLFWYPGFAEGWGAYVEHLGKELGVYKTIYDEYGKWEWDLIRSVRVCLDIGINYKGWSDKKALAFWNQHIIDKEEIAKREISRMKRWPAQVITYKYGEAVFLSLLKEAKNKPGFNYKKFHERVLEYGDVPISLLKLYDFSD